MQPVVVVPRTWQIQDADSGPDGGMLWIPGRESPKRILLTRDGVCTALVMYCLQPERLKPFERCFLDSAVVAMDISGIGAGFLTGKSVVVFVCTILWWSSCRGYKAASELASVHHEPCSGSAPTKLTNNCVIRFATTRTSDRSRTPPKVSGHGPPKIFIVSGSPARRHCCG